MGTAIPNWEASPDSRPACASPPSGVKKVVAEEDVDELEEENLLGGCVVDFRHSQLRWKVGRVAPPWHEDDVTLLEAKAPAGVAPHQVVVQVQPGLSTGRCKGDRRRESLLGGGPSAPRRRVPSPQARSSKPRSQHPACVTLRSEEMKRS